MQVKKYLAVFSLMMIMCLSILPSFTSAAVVNVMNEPKVKEKYFSRYPELYGGGNSQGIYVTNRYSVDIDLGDVYKITGHTTDSFTAWGAENSQIQYIGVDKRVLASFVDKEFDRSYQTFVGVRYIRVNYIRNNSDYGFYLKRLVVYGDNGAVSDVQSLIEKTDFDKVSFNWSNPPETVFSGVKVYRDDELITTVDKNLNSYVADGLKPNTNYKFKFVAFGDNGKEASGVTKNIKTLPDPKTIPPGPVSSLVAEATDKTVKLKWKSPKDDDLAGFKILQNGKQIAEIGLEEEFTVKNLQPLTDYNFGVIAVDRDKNDSSPVNLSVKTLEENDEEPPHVPSNVFAKPSNGALIASWDKVSDKDLAGYNVYVDGKKINSNLISSTNFSIKNLENDKKYKVQVQAVDRSGNASELSSPVFGTPDMNTIPLVESKYNLQDVSDGVGNQFWQLWPFLAWYLGIPLSFYVIYKFKQVYLP
ncbi:TPA: fibronectin type III domain-containing protein [Bacillus cereus]